MNLKNIKIDAKKTVGNTTLLVDVIPTYEYIEGKRTDKITAYKYVIVLPERGFEKISVKIEGNQLIDSPEDGYTEVHIDNLTLSLYWRAGTYDISAKATGIREVKTNS